MAFNATDVNDGTVYILDRNNVRALYELDIFRQIVMSDGTIYDVSETYDTLTQDIGGGGGGGGGL